MYVSDLALRRKRSLRLKQRPELGRQQAQIKVIGSVGHGRRIARKPRFDAAQLSP